MKKAILIAVFALLGTGAFAQSAKAIYSKYSGQEGVQGIYISESMFKMIGGIPELPLGDMPMDISPYLKTMKGMYLLNTSKDSQLYDDVQKLVNAGKYELMMEVNDGSDKVNIYTEKSGNMITSFVLLVGDSSECVFICLDGQISEEDFQKLISEAMKNA